MILVTGASGLLGAHLTALARDQGREVAGLYYRHSPNLPGVRVVSLDLADEKELTRVFRESGAQAVIHCAAETNVDWCEEHPDRAHEINALVPGTLARLTAQSGARMLYISTDAVFDGTRGNYAESDRPNPLNVYARTKLDGESEVLRNNPQAAIARVTLFGRSWRPKPSLAEWMIARLASGEVVPAFTDVIFCPMYAADMAQILFEIVDRELVGLYHATGSQAVSKYEFAKGVAVAFGFDPSLVVPARLADAKLKAPRPRNTSLNTKKIATALGHAMPEVESGLRKFAALGWQFPPRTNDPAEVCRSRGGTK